MNQVSKVCIDPNNSQKKIQLSASFYSLPPAFFELPLTPRPFNLQRASHRPPSPLPGTPTVLHPGRHEFLSRPPFLLKTSLRGAWHPDTISFRLSKKNNLTWKFINKLPIPFAIPTLKVRIPKLAQTFLSSRSHPQMPIIFLDPQLTLGPVLTLGPEDLTFAVPVYRNDTFRSTLDLRAHVGCFWPHSDIYGTSLEVERTAVGVAHHRFIQNQIFCKASAPVVDVGLFRNQTRSLFLKL